MRFIKWAALLIFFASIGRAADAPVLPAYPEVQPGEKMERDIFANVRFSVTSQAVS